MASEMSARTEEREYPFKRRAIIQLNEQEVGTLLGLPEGVYVRAINWNHRTFCLEVCVYGNRFRVVPDNAEAPGIDKELTIAECDQGVVHIKTLFPEDNDG